MNKTFTRFASLAAAGTLAGAGLVATSAPAEAAGTVWDRVATCESGGNWSINTGNGYSGGLQFSKSTWRAYGGAKYAPTANRASKAQQILIAQRTLRGQGPRAWPVCSKRAGLTRANGAVPYGAPAKAPAKAAKPAPKRALPAKAVSAAYQGKRFITVKSGDTISKLARTYKVKGGWKALHAMNKATVKNPNMIRVGQRLAIG